MGLAYRCVSLFHYTMFHGWTYRTLYISCLMGLYIAAR